MGFFNNNSKEIKKVKLLGIRTAEQTKILGTYNSSLFCLLVLYSDNSKELVECESKEFQKKYINYIEF